MKLTVQLALGETKEGNAKRSATWKKFIQVTKEKGTNASRVLLDEWIPTYLKSLERK